MATYVGLIQFADQGIRNIKDTVKRGDAAMAEAKKMGMKIVEEFWTMGAYDAVVVFDAPDDETMSAFMLKIGSLGNVKSHTMCASGGMRWKRFWLRSNSCCSSPSCDSLASDTPRTNAILWCHAIMTFPEVRPIF